MMTLLPGLEGVAQAALYEYSGSIRTKQVPRIFNDATSLRERAAADLDYGAVGRHAQEFSPLCVNDERLEGLRSANGSLAVACVEEGVKRSFQPLFEQPGEEVSGKVRLLERDGEIIGEAYPDDVVHRGPLFDIQRSRSFGRSGFFACTEYLSSWFQTVTAKLLRKARYHREITGDLGLLNKRPAVTTDHSGHQAAGLKCGKGVTQRHSADPKSLRELSFWGKFGSWNEVAAADGVEQVVLDLLVWRDLRLSTQPGCLGENC